MIDTVSIVRRARRLAKGSVLSFYRDQGTHHAAALTYYALMSLFPTLLLGVSLLGLFGQYPATYDSILGHLRSVVPAATLVTEQPRLTVASSEGATEQRQGRDTGAERKSDSGEAVSEAKAAGSRRGRSKAAIAAAEAEAAAAAAEAAAAEAAADAVAAGGSATASGGEAGGRGVVAGRVVAEETVVSGSEQNPGRIYHWRNIANRRPPA